MFINRNELEKIIIESGVEVLVEDATLPIFDVAIASSFIKNIATLTAKKLNNLHLIRGKSYESTRVPATIDQTEFDPEIDAPKKDPLTAEAELNFNLLKKPDGIKYDPRSSEMICVLDFNKRHHMTARLPSWEFGFKDCPEDWEIFYTILQYLKEIFEAGYSQDVQGNLCKQINAIIRYTNAYFFTSCGGRVGIAAYYKNDDSIAIIPIITTPISTFLNKLKEISPEIIPEIDGKEKEIASTKQSQKRSRVRTSCTPRRKK